MHIIHKVNAALKSKLVPLFNNHHRVDLGIDSILEGQSGKQVRVTVDDVNDPNVAFIRYGTFGVLHSCMIIYKKQRALRLWKAL